MTDELDRVSDLENFHRETAINAHVNRVKEVPEEYGYCNDCGDVIPAERLAAIPDAVTCHTCQQLREHRRPRGVGTD